MKLTRVTKGPVQCAGGNCPTIYTTDRDTIVVQGYRIDEPVDVDVPASEGIVEIPMSVLREAAQLLG